MSVYIIAEAGVNHNGKLDLALKLCDAAKEAGVNAVKFQTWKTENIVTASACMATYQKKNIQTAASSQYEMLKRLELSYEHFAHIQEHCKQIGIDFLSTPDEEESLDFLMSLSLPLIKVGSGEVTNIPYLRTIGSKKKPVILSTGMSTMEEVERAVKFLSTPANGSKAVSIDDIVVLQCNTQYPTPYQDVNLLAMPRMGNALGVRYGYSDHTKGIEIPVAAVALGACVIEKHFTLDRSLPGPDHKASLEPSELKEMIARIRNVEQALGNPLKRVTDSEKDNIIVARKSLVAARDIRKGETFTKENLAVKRPGNGISPWNIYDVIGRVAKRDFPFDSLIEL